MTAAREWMPYKNGATIGSVGSENGIILSDEELADTCRVTLERCSQYHVITCCVYDAMMHTAFCGPDGAGETYERMKDELARFISSDATEEDEQKFYEEFCNQFS